METHTSNIVLSMYVGDHTTGLPFYLIWRLQLLKAVVENGGHKFQSESVRHTQRLQQLMYTSFLRGQSTHGCPQTPRHGPRNGPEGQEEACIRPCRVAPSVQR